MTSPEQNEGQKDVLHSVDTLRCTVSTLHALPQEGVRQTGSASQRGSGGRPSDPHKITNRLMQNATETAELEQGAVLGCEAAPGLHTPSNRFCHGSCSLNQQQVSSSPMTNADASNPLVPFSGGSLCHTCSYVCTHQHAPPPPPPPRQMHNRTRSLIAVLHSSNRPANLIQGMPVCDCEPLQMGMCACSRARANSSGNVTLREKLEHGGRKGLTDQDRGMTRGKKRKCGKTKGMKI